MLFELFGTIQVFYKLGSYELFQLFILLVCM